MAAHVSRVELASIGLGVSEIAAIAGLSPFATATDVWLDKTGLGRGRGDTPAMGAGRQLERPILKLAGRRLELELKHNRQTFRHPDWPAVPLFATPDGFSPGRRQLAEVKLVGHRWSDWSDGIPDYVVAQARGQLACLPRSSSVYVIALLGSDLRIQSVERDVRLEDRLVELAVAWWQRHVIGGVAPDPDGPDDAWNVLRATAKLEARSERLATTDEQRTAAELMTLQRQIADLELRADELKLELAEAARDSDVMGVGWSGRWQTRSSPAWKTIAIEAGADTALVAAHTSRSASFAFRRSDAAA